MKASTTIAPDKDDARPNAVLSTAPMGLRERKKLETFRALQAAARRLVGERGLDNVTVDEIADAANVSKRTFFNYFETKEAAIVDYEPGAVERFAANLAARPADETIMQAVWEAGVASLAHGAYGMQEVSQLICANPQLVVHQVAAYGALRKVILDWTATRTGTDPATDVYPELLARVINVLLNMTVSRWQPETGTEGFLQLADQIYTLLAGGLDVR